MQVSRSALEHRRASAGGASKAYDYLLVAGPGRSGSEFLYKNLKNNPGFVFPELKEGYYYRSTSRFRKALGRAEADGAVLADIANLAYADPALISGVEALQDAGRSILLVVLLRDHRDRAVSMMRFRKSRGEASALRGARRLEEAVVRDRLTPRRLAEIYALDVDVLAVRFPALVDSPEAVLDVLCLLCGVPKPGCVERGVVNRSQRARFVWLSMLGKLLAAALRRLGLGRLLQRLKGSSLAGKLFFVPLAAGEDAPRLSAESAAVLEDAFRECRAWIESESERIREGVYLRMRRGAAGVSERRAAWRTRG